MGLACCYTHKCIKCTKIANYVTTCLVQHALVDITHHMCQLEAGPEWVHCTLPLNNLPTSLSTYLTSVLQSKKRVCSMLDRERLKCYSSRGDNMVASATLLSPKGLSRFWRKL